jgi:hypothetical protein
MADSAFSKRSKIAIFSVLFFVTILAMITELSPTAAWWIRLLDASGWTLAYIAAAVFILRKSRY